MTSTTGTGTGETSSSSGKVLPSIDYPHVIRGSLRLILQLKDAFLTCFNLVEEYREQLLNCKQSFARDLVIYQLTHSLVGINRLREDLLELEQRGMGLQRRNTVLRQFIIEKYREQLGKAVFDFMPSTRRDGPSSTNTGGAEVQSGDLMGSKCHNPTAMSTAYNLPPPITAPNSVDAALHGGLEQLTCSIDIDSIDVPEEVNLAEAVTPSGQPLMPVVDFYRAFYFLQMHFQLIMCQAANYAMPVVSNPMTAFERAFAWPRMPSFGLPSNSGSMRDRLLTIYTDLQQLAERLSDCLTLAQSKLDQDKYIESYYLQHSAGQEAVRRNILRCLQAQRVYIDCLESQNDRLAGITVKIDPTFAHSTEFDLMTGSFIPFLPEVDRHSSSNKLSNVNASIGDGANPGAGETMIELTSSVSSSGCKSMRMSSSRDPSFNYDDNNDHRRSGPNEDQVSRIKEASGVLSNITEVSETDITQSRQHTSLILGTSQPVEVNGLSEPDDYNNTGYKSDPNSTLSPTLDTIKPVESSKQSSHGKSTSSQLGNRSGQTIETDIGERLEQVGHLGPPGVAELLIGVDANAPGVRQSLSSKPSGSHQSSKSSEKASNNLCILTDAEPEQDSKIIENKAYLASPTTRYSRAESMTSPSEVPVEQNTLTTNTTTLVQRTQSMTDLSRQDKTSPENEDEDDERSTTRPESEQSTGSPPLDNTNVNFNQSNRRRHNRQHHRSRDDLDLLSNTTQEQEQELRQMMDLNRSQNNQFSDFADQYIHHQHSSSVNNRQGVGIVECKKCTNIGCSTKWPLTRARKTENLLEEPKRSALRRALTSHRVKLVETILQADEERLEELIALLMNKSG